jgi:hypothetical protein
MPCDTMSNPNVRARVARSTRDTEANAGLEWVGDGLSDTTTQKTSVPAAYPPLLWAPWRNHVGRPLCPDIKIVLTAFADTIHERARRCEMRKYREMYRLDTGSDTQRADQVEATPPGPSWFVYPPGAFVRLHERVRAPGTNEIFRSFVRVLQHT